MDTEGIIMRAEELKKAIMESLKVIVKKTWDTTGNDNSRQNSEKPNTNGNLYPLRLEEFSINISFNLPKDEPNVYGYGLISEGKKSLGFTLRRRTLITQEEKKLIEELTERKKRNGYYQRRSYS